MLAHSFLIESSSKLLVTGTNIKAWMSLILGLWFPWPIYMFFEMRFDLGSSDSGERSLPFGLRVSENFRTKSILFSQLKEYHLKFHYHVIFSCAMMFSELQSSSSSGSGSMKRSLSRGSLKGLLSPSKLDAHCFYFLALFPSLAMKLAASWQNKQNDLCAQPSEDSDQPGHLPSLIKVFAVHMKKHWVLGYP